MTIRFAHISDLHFSTDYKDKAGEYSAIMMRMDDPFSQLRSVFDGRQVGLDFVLLSGDICEYGSVAEYAYVKRWLVNYFDCPVYAVSGNHEDRTAFRKGFLQQEDDGILFEDHIENKARIICLDSSSPDYKDGFISEASCQKLAQALEHKTSLPTLLMTHHHLLAEQSSMPRAQYPAGFADLVRTGDLMAIFTGHTHHIYTSVFEGVPYYTTGAFSFAAEPVSGQLDFYQHPAALLFEIDDKDRLSCEKLDKGRQRYLGALKL